MSYIPRSSLIPTETSGAIPLQIKKRRTLHIFGSFATLLFFLSLVASGGVFFYNDYLRKDLALAKEGLSTVSKIDNEEKIEELRTYNERLNIGNSLLNNHIAASTIFSKLESSTKETVQFDSLEFTYDPGFGATLTLTGNTNEFSSLALQKMQFLDDTLFSEFVIKDVSTSDGDTNSDESVTTDTETTKGKASFSISGRIRKGALDYTGDSGTKRSTIQTETNPVVSEKSFIPDQKATTTATSTIIKESIQL